MDNSPIQIYLSYADHNKSSTNGAYLYIWKHFYVLYIEDKDGSKHENIWDVYSKEEKEQKTR